MDAKPPSEFRSGWTVVLAAAVGVGFGATGLAFYTMGLFVKPLAAEFGWSRAAISAAGLCLQGGLVVTAPFVGRMVDRLGVRRVALTSLVGLSAAFAGLTLIGGSILSLYLAWTLLALLACGTTPIVWTRTVNAAFERSRGLALGLTLMGTGLAAVLGPMVIGPLIAERGWRAGYLALAAGALVIALPIVWRLLREPAAHSAAQAAAAASGMTLAQAVRTRRFWQGAAGFILVGGAIAAVIVHLAPMMTDAGMAPGQAAGMMAGLGLAIIAGRVVVGALVDRFHAPHVGFVFLLAPVGGCLLLAQGHPALAIAAFGLAAGAEVDLLAYLVTRQFGLRAYGEIYGWQLALFSLSAGIGPILLGAAQDAMGTYTPALYVCAVAILAGAVLIGTLGRFADRDA